MNIKKDKLIDEKKMKKSDYSAILYFVVIGT